MSGIPNLIPIELACIAIASLFYMWRDGYHLPRVRNLMLQDRKELRNLFESHYG